MIETGDAKPQHCNPHQMPHRLRGVLREELDDMLERGYIEPSESDWAAPIVYVRKKCGGWRLCVDFRKLNAVAREDAYPLPRIQDVFTALEGAQYFSSIDLAKGFWQIEIDESSRRKTAFTTIYGLYQFRRLPMGLNSAPAAFQRAMSAVLCGLNWIHVMVYLDDILIFTPTFEEHLRVLDDVLGRLHRANFKCKLGKCEFARTQLQYLGHIINSQGIQVDPDKVAAVKAFPDPTCVKDVETFLGKAGYYCRFIQNFSRLAKPLFQLKKKGVEWTWGDEQRFAFETLKQRLCEAPVLHHPDFSKPFLLQTDASGYGLGAVLAQNFEDGEHPVCYASRTLKDAEMRYAAIEREALAIFWATRHFQQYLIGGHFTIQTDHKPLLSLMTKTHINTRLLNYTLRLQHFNFSIEYKEGISNGNADALSRGTAEKYPIIPLRTQKHKKLQCSLGPEGLKPTGGTFLGLTMSDGSHPQPRHPGVPVSEAVWRTTKATMRTSAVAWQNLAARQESDVFFGPIRRYLRGEDVAPVPEMMAYRMPEISDLFYLTQDDKILVRADTSPGDRSPICIPEDFVSIALDMAHNAPHAGHHGAKGTLRYAQKHFWWPRMSSQCVKYVRACAACARHKSFAKRPVTPLSTIDPPSAVWDRLHMDYFSAGDGLTDGPKGVLGFVDAFSKFSVLEAVEDYTAATAVRVFINQVANVFGAPLHVVSDQGPGFKAAFERASFLAMGVKRTHVVAWRPQANGNIERVFGSLRPILATLTTQFPGRWAEMLPAAAHAYNTSYHRSIDQTPFYVMFGRDPQYFDYSLSQSFYDQDKTQNESVRESFNRLQEVRDIVRERIYEQRLRNKQEYDAVIAQYYANRKFAKQMLIWVKVHCISQPPANSGRPRKNTKLHPKFVGPWRITDVQGYHVWAVPINRPNWAPKKIHFDHIKQCLSDDTIGDDDDRLLTPFNDMQTSQGLESEAEEEA